MKINKNINNETLTISVDGRLDTITSPELENEVTSSIRGIKELVFDFNELDYISSAGLRVLLAAQKLMSEQGSMYITGCSEDILSIFEITGFSDILTIK
ncbi:STAS domain-containing protein [Ruminococcus sp. NK3A76]|uniref:STAS domain-containing protein n=1 Tax=Ruminococcus sp. NK3A76 TaxID=877411 RepID=UPI00048E9B82|nr:STAS domain-containing protein [Ruminococcus sp. NK3A76]